MADAADLHDLADYLHDLTRDVVHLASGDLTIWSKAGLSSRARTAAILCRALAQQLTAETCPGPHRAEQHRDGRPAWCRACRRTLDGVPLSDLPGIGGRAGPAGAGADDPHPADHDPGAADRGPAR